MKTTAVIKPITAYKVNYKGGGRYRYGIFPHVAKAALMIAWWMIDDKYFPGHEDLGREEPPERFECICDKGDWDLDPTDCPLHDRKTGYYTRVRNRLARWIINGHTKVDNKQKEL